jgi:hypothetical protein
MSSVQRNVLVGMLLVCLLATLGFAPSASADAVYTYTGSPYTTWTGALSCGTVCSFDGSFTVPSLLPDSATTVVTPTAFDFYISTADTPSWTNLNGATRAITVTTNALGQIVNWDVLLFASSGGTYPVGGTCDLTSPCPGAGGVVTQIDFFATTSAQTNSAYNTGAAGKWQVTTPEPSTLLLLCSGLLGLMGMAFRRKRLA